MPKRNRDARGRWVKGRSGNPAGRPKRVPDFDMSDVFNFANDPVEMMINGQKVLMTRHEVLLAKTFESAIKGRVTSQRYLLEKFEQAELSREQVLVWLEKWADRIQEDPKSVPSDVVFAMERAMQVHDRPRSTLRTRNPGKRENKNHPR